jgi:hypothetical protein
VLGDKPLKDMLRAIGLDEVYLGSLKELPCPLLCGATPRHAMQALGSEWGRNLIHPDLWVTLWREKAYQSKAPLIVADDVRFANEAATVLALGGTLLRVRRHDAPGGEAAEGTKITAALKRALGLHYHDPLPVSVRRANLRATRRNKIAPPKWSVEP